MASRGPRRTRMYDCNFDAGQNYYKSALDGLDKKYNKNESTEKALLSRPKLNVDDLLDEDLQLARRRAQHAIVDDAFFDTAASGKLQKNRAKSVQLNIDDDIDEEVRASLNRIRANKKLSALPKDQDIEETISTVKRRARIDLGEKLLDAAGNDEAGTVIRRRALKLVTRASDDYVDPSKLTKWTALGESNETNKNKQSLAIQRAKATKERLRDLESEMFERSEKQAAREKRSANIKKFLIESEIDTSSVVKSESKAEKRVNF